MMSCIQPLHICFVGAQWKYFNISYCICHFFIKTISPRKIKFYAFNRNDAINYTPIINLKPNYQHMGQNKTGKVSYIVGFNTQILTTIPPDDTN